MGCVGSKGAEASQLEGTDTARPDTKDAFMLAERFFGATVTFDACAATIAGSA
jgi:hypothetical protein